MTGRAEKNTRAGDLVAAYDASSEQVALKPEQAFQLACEMDYNKRWQEAENIYRQLLQSFPRSFELHSNLGAVLQAQGKLDLAMGSYQAALALRPDHAALHGNLGTVLLAMGRATDAEASYRRALQLQPDDAETLCHLGVALHAGGNIDEALECLGRAVARAPRLARAHFNLGNVLREAGRLGPAIESYTRALEIDPIYAKARQELNATRQARQHERDAADLAKRLDAGPGSAAVHSDYGNTLRFMGRNDEAKTHYQHALALDPRFAFAYGNLGALLADEGQHEAAIAVYRQALEMGCDNAEIHLNLGSALHFLQRFNEAEVSYRRALELKPNYPEAISNLASVLHDQYRVTEAIALYRRALEQSPGLAKLHRNLGAALQVSGDLAGALASYRHAVDLDPRDSVSHYFLGGALLLFRQREEAIRCFREALRFDRNDIETLYAMAHQLQQLCNWQELEALLPRLFSNNVLESGKVAAFILLTLDNSTPEQQFTAIHKYARKEFPAPPPLRDYAARTERLRIGYMSGDFREHPVAYLTAELFELHDRSRFEIIGYSLYGNALRSELRDRIRSGCDDFVDLEALAPVAAAERIHADGVHILVDLSGYTERSRPKTLALRPAPLQINYLGYPGTMGAPFIDYLITDRFVTPLDQQPHYSEQFAYLPHCFQPNDRGKAIAEQTPSRAACGLPETGFVFCSFNRSYKITPRVFEVWMQLLTALPGSVLWLSDLEATAMENLRREAQARGVAPARLVFAARTDSMADHLARHRQADLFLDTLPYNAHTTASDALWAGLPLLTCAGETFAARVAGSLLHAVGLPELVTHSLEDYQALALKLAREPQLLAGYRRRLAENRLTCALFDSARYARDLERVYELMWEHHQHGRPPQLIEV